MTHAVVALGANLGDRAATLADAVTELAATDEVTVVAVSPLYDTIALIQRSGLQLSPATAEFASMAEKMLLKSLKISKQGVVDQSKIADLISE